MKIKFDLENFPESNTAFRAILGVWGDKLTYLVRGDETDAVIASLAEPVHTPTVATSITGLHRAAEPVAEPVETVAAPTETIVVAQPQAEPADETPPAADGEVAAEVTALIAGRALTKSVKLADGPQVKAGDDVYTLAGDHLVIEATVRGTAICIDETGRYHEMPSGRIYSTQAAAAEAARGSTVVVTATAPTIEDAVVVSTTPAVDTAGLAPDYLLAELHEAGNKVKKARSVAAVLTALNEVSPGTNRLSDLPVDKRDALLVKFNSLVA
jgi:hypothetical protein